MEQREFMDQIRKLHGDNPGRFIKIRDAFDEILGEKEISSVQLISDRQFERIRYKFQEIDVPFSWYSTKESVYQLQKAVRNYRSQNSRYDEEPEVRRPSKPKKKGIFGLFK